MVTKMERNIKLELKTQQKEILSHCYVLYKEKLIYQHMRFVIVVTILI